MKLKAVTAILACFLSAVSCKSQFEALLESGDDETKYRTAFELFNEGKYQKAAQLFESLSISSSGTERDDTVQFYWGLSNYSNKDYYTAQTNFDRFLNNYPSGAFTESAKFLRIDCLFKETLRYELDQGPTYNAIKNINEYLIEHPYGSNAAVCHQMLDELNDRLDRKAYENARLYYRMEDYIAARVALRNVLKDNAENRYREDILYYIAMSSYKYAMLSVKSKQKERILTFVDDYLNFVGEYPESSRRRELDDLYRKVKGEGEGMILMKK